MPKLKTKPAWPPTHYDVTIIVKPSDGHGAELKVSMPGIARADIMAMDYPSKGVTAAVKLLEQSCCEDEVPHAS